mgnify:CR=1 FL=1
MATYLQIYGRLATLFLLFMSMHKVYGQNISQYNFSLVTENWTEINVLNGAIFPTRTGTFDEGYYNGTGTGINIGFDFWYMGKAYKSFAVSTNGWMTLDQTITNAIPDNVSTASVRPIIAPLWDNLRIQPGVAGILLAGDVSYRLIGTEGSRMLTVQWRDMEWPSGSTNRISFQVSLSEATGSITYSYIRVVGSNPGTGASASIGISGGQNEHYYLNSIATPAVAPTFYSALATFPANNTNYRFQSTVAAATSLTFSNVGPKQLTLNWNDVATDNIGYAIYRSTNATTGFTRIGNVLLGANATSFTDVGLTENTTYYYKVFAVKESVSTALTGFATTTPCPLGYPAGAQVNYRFNGNAVDELGANNGQFQGGIPTPTADRFGNANHAYQFNGTSQYMSTSSSFTSPSNFTISCWFKTTSTEGGKLISFGSNQTGSSTSHDRHLYMLPDGKIYFGVYPGAVRTINTTASFNDGNWHQVTAILSSTGGMSLYVDGVLRASNNTFTSAQSYVGYWRVGYDRMDNTWTGWPSTARTDAYFSGAIDDVMIYNRALTATEVTTLYQPTFTASYTGPVCFGYTFGLIASSIPGATYSWTGPNNYTSSQQNPTGIILNQSTIGLYTVAISVAGACSTTASVRVAPSVNNPGVWAGRSDVNWSNASNWCDVTVPTATVNVTIPTTGPSFNPTLNATSSINSINVQSGRILTISGAGDLQIAGAVTNTGSIVADAGKVTFNGTTAQAIPANVFAGNLIKDLTINNAAGVTLNGALRLTGVLTATNGIFNANGNLTLASSASQTAQVAQIPIGASVRGQVKVERFVSGGAKDLYRGYRMLSSPVYDNTTNFSSSDVEGNRTARFAQLKDDVILTGAGGAANGFDQSQSNPAGAWTHNLGYVPISNINTTVNAGRGMYLFFRGNRDNISAKTTTPYPDPENVVIDFDGVLNQQDVTVSLNYSPTLGGFNLLGNPYASTIDWESPNLEKTNVGDAIWVWNPVKKSYATYTRGLSSLNGSNFISSGQSFFVRALAPGTIKFKESVKVAGQQPSVLLMSATSTQTDFSLGIVPQQTSQPRGVIRVKMNPIASFGEDETIIAISEGSNASYTAEDAIHLNGEIVNIASLIGTQKLAINFLPPSSAKIVVPLSVNTASTGNYIFNFNMNEYFQGYSLFLKDNFTQQLIPINSGANYNFNIDKSNSETFGDNRFSIFVEPPTVLPLGLLSFKANKQHKGVQLSWLTTDNFSNKGFKLYRAGSDGVYTLLGNLQSNGSSSHFFTDTFPLLGYNYYKLLGISANGEMFEAGPLVVDFTTAAANDLIIYPNPIKESFTVQHTSLEEDRYKVSLYELSGRKLSGDIVSDKELNAGYQIDSSKLNSGIFMLKIEKVVTGEIIAVEKLVKN